MTRPSSFRLPGWALPLTCALALLAGCDRTADPVPVVVLAKGTVKAANGAVVRAGERLLESRSLAVAEDSFAAVSLTPGVVLCLDAGARAELLPARLVKRDDQMVEREARVRLLAGRAFLRVAVLEGRTQIRIESAGGEVRAVGEAMAEMQLAADNSLAVTCSTGLVHVSRGIEVSAGFYTVSENGVFGLAKEAAQETARWQRIVALQEIERVVEEIFTRQRALRP